MGIVNLKFKRGVTCPIFQNHVLRTISDSKGTTYGSKRVGISPERGTEVIQEFIGLSNGEEVWESLHNINPEDDARDVEHFRKFHSKS